MKNLPQLKISARERDLAPRFYYKRTKTYTCFQRIKNFIRKVLAFLFTQVGVCCLIAAYTLIGAFIFSEVEAESQMKEAELAREMRFKLAKDLWNITLHTNVIFGEDWRKNAEQLVKQFQDDMIKKKCPKRLHWYRARSPDLDLHGIADVFAHCVYNDRCKEPMTHTLPTKATLPAVLAEDITPIGSKAEGSKSKRSSESFSESKFTSGIRNLRSTIRYKKKKNSDPSGAENASESQTSPSAQGAKPQLVVSEVHGLGHDEGDGGRSDETDLEQGLVNSLSVPKRGDSPGTPTSIGLKSAFPFNTSRKISTNSMNPSIKEEQSSPSRSSSSPAAFSGSQNVTKTPTVEFKLVEDIRLVTIPVTSCLLVLMTYITIGTITFSAWEGWNYLDGAYFCFTSLMTIGFGDFVPGNEYIFQVDENMNEYEARAKLVLGTVYILLGMALVAMCLNLMQENVIVRIRTFARRIGLIRPARYSDS